MDSKVVYKCTVYGPHGAKLFHVDGVTMAIAAELAQTVLQESNLDGRTWQFEKIYPEPVPFQLPNMDDRLEEFANGVAAIANAPNQV